MASLRAMSATAAAARGAENHRAQADLSASAVPLVAPAAARTSAATAPSVTLTGCLEPHHDGFQLKDASGDAAPKSRSWKSGFLKKGTPALDVVDSTKRLKLKDHLGQRVSVTGVLVDREMQARTMKSVGTCE
jgi:hypothetical protein